MYTFELSDIMFFIKSIRNPTTSFIIHPFSTCARLQGFKLHHNPSTTNKQRHFYFARICCLWNVLPLMELIYLLILLGTELRHISGIILHITSTPSIPIYCTISVPAVGVLLIIFQSIMHCYRQFIMCFSFVL